MSKGTLSAAVACGAEASGWLLLVQRNVLPSYRLDVAVMELDLAVESVAQDRLDHARVVYVVVPSCPNRQARL